MTRTFFPALAALLLAAAAPPVLAQAPAQPPYARPATTWERVDEPLSSLLNGGYRIVAMTGPAFTLEKGGTYLLCALTPPGGLRGVATATSECHRLN